MGDGDELTDASGLAPDQAASDATRLDELSTLTARLEAQLDQVDGEPTEPAQSRLKVEAFLTARLVVTKWLQFERGAQQASDQPTWGKIGVPIAEIEPSWIGSPLTRVCNLFSGTLKIGPSSDEPVAHRVLPDRHLDGVEELKSSYARHVQALEALTSMDGRIRVSGPGGAQMLVDELLHRLEIERISQVRDSWSLVKRNELSQVDPSLPSWLLTINQDRHGPPVDWATVADAEIWPRLSTRDRAEAVSDRVRYVLSSAPDRAITIRPSDIVSATNGDFEAWQRLTLDHLETDAWWQTMQQMQGSSSLPTGTLFASRSDLTPAERADRDFLREKWDDIERSRREFRRAHALATIHPGDPGEDRDAAQLRQARLGQLDQEERDVVAALQKYSVMPRQILTESAQTDPSRTVSPSTSGEPSTGLPGQEWIGPQAHLAGLELQRTILSRQASIERQMGDLSGQEAPQSAIAAGWANDELQHVRGDVDENERAGMLATLMDMFRARTGGRRAHGAALLFGGRLTFGTAEEYRAERDKLLAELARILGETEMFRQGESYATDNGASLAAEFASLALARLRAQARPDESLFRLLDHLALAEDAAEQARSGGQAHKRTPTSADQSGVCEHDCARSAEMDESTEHRDSGSETPDAGVCDETTASENPDQTKLERARVLSDGQFRQRLNEAGRRLLTGDTSGPLTNNDKALVGKRRLTRTAVCGLIGIHRSTLPSYHLDPAR